MTDETYTHSDLWRRAYTASHDDHTYEFDTYDDAKAGVIDWYQDEGYTDNRLVHIYEVRIAPNEQDPQDQLDDEEEFISSIKLWYDGDQFHMREVMA